MISGYFAGKTIIVWPLRKIVTLSLRPLRPNGNLAMHESISGFVQTCSP